MDDLEAFVIERRFKFVSVRVISERESAAGESFGTVAALHQVYLSELSNPSKMLRRNAMLPC